MLDGLRDRMAAGFSILAERLSTEPRYPNVQRVPHTARTLAGVSITPDTACTVATVWACLRYLSQTVAVLPWHVKRDEKKGSTIQNRHPVDNLLWKRPNEEWSAFQFRETMTHWALRWGNGYAEIEEDQLGRPFAIWPIHPQRVRICRATEDGYSNDGVEIPAGKLFYEVSNYANSWGWSDGGSPGGGVVVPAGNMFHIRGFGEGPVGVNVMDYASQSIGWARAAQLFSAAFFGNGMNIGGVVLNKKPLTKDGLKRQREEFEQLYRGPMRASKTAFLDNDADWKAIGFNPQQSQLIEIQQHLVEECCRWFGVPPHKVMHLLRATFTNIESQGIEVVVDSISPWVKRFEDEADYKLFGANRQGLYSKIDMRALMRGDAASRSAYYQSMRNMGAYSVNRILELEDENTIGPDGDKHVMQSQFTTLEKIGEDAVPDTVDPAEDAAGDPAEAPPAPGQDPGEDVAASLSGDEADALEAIGRMVVPCLV